MSSTAKIASRKTPRGKRHAAFIAAVTIVQMDPHAREDLICYLKAFNEAQATGDKQEQEYLVKAISEMFEIDNGEDGTDLTAWRNQIKSSTKGRKASESLRHETNRFFDIYRECKIRSGLTTIRAVAQAAGLSPTTVQAIEKQKVKPQFKTIQALAKAFGVEAKKLNCN